MSDDDRALLVDKCGEIVHTALVEIRNLSFGPGNERRINALADLLHNVPRFMVGQDEHVTVYLRVGFERFEKEHGRADRYLHILDMDRSEFDERYRQAQWSWPEPAEATK